MIASLKGIVEELNPRNIVITVNDVGYEVGCTLSTTKELTLGQVSKLLIYTEVKEDAFKLHGFISALEREVFKCLIKVKGVGTRIAADILSQAEPSALLNAIANDDISYVVSFKGVGKKTAERLVLELRDTAANLRAELGIINDKPKSSILGANSFSSQDTKKNKQSFDTPALNDAVEALQVLGYSKDIAITAVNKFADSYSQELSSINSGDIVKQSLRFI